MKQVLSLTPGSMFKHMPKKLPLTFNNKTFTHFSFKKEEIVETLVGSRMHTRLRLEEAVKKTE